MVVGAHISDAENMAGAVMLKHKRAGWDVTIVHVTAGDKGHTPPITRAVSYTRKTGRTWTATRTTYT